jgi:hypothetical protein
MVDKALIERLAREAGREVAPFEEAWEAARGFFFTEEELTAFAHLIADECAKVADELRNGTCEDADGDAARDGMADRIRSKFSKG